MIARRVAWGCLAFALAAWALIGCAIRVLLQVDHEVGAEGVSASAAASAAVTAARAASRP